MKNLIKFKHSATDKAAIMEEISPKWNKNIIVVCNMKFEENSQNSLAQWFKYSPSKNRTDRYY